MSELKHIPGFESIGQKNIIEAKDKEIERLKEMKLHTEKYASEMEDKYILEKYKNNKAIEYCKELMLFKKNSRQYLIGKCMLEKLGGDDKE